MYMFLCLQCTTNVHVCVPICIYMYAHGVYMYVHNLHLVMYYMYITKKPCVCHWENTLHLLFLHRTPLALPNALKAAASAKRKVREGSASSTASRSGSEESRKRKRSALEEIKMVRWYMYTIRDNTYLSERYVLSLIQYVA